MLVFIGLIHRETSQRQHRLIDAVWLTRGFSVGRASDNTVVIDDPSIQEHHIEITQEPARFTLLVREGTARIIPYEREVTPRDGKQSFGRPIVLLLGKIELRFFDAPFSQEDIDALRSALTPYAALAWPPIRPQRDAVLECAESPSLDALSDQLFPEDAQELWERLSARDLIPQEWLFSHAREFRHGWQLGLHPLSVQQAASLALAPQAILTAESLIPDLLYTFGPWGISGAKHVVWSASPRWQDYTTPMDLLAGSFLNLFSAYRQAWTVLEAIPLYLIPSVNPMVHTRSLEWLWWWLSEQNAHTEPDEWSNFQQGVMRLPSTTTDCFLRDLPNPFEPLRRLAELGVQVTRLSPDSDDLELCLIV